MDENFQLLMQKLDAMQEQISDLKRENRVLYRQIEALFALYHQLDLHVPLLGMRGWAASPDFLALIAQHIRNDQPQAILEAGSGQSTLISAYALAQSGQGHIYSVDHVEKFAQRTRDMIARHSLNDYATVYYAPLKPYDINGEAWFWYDLNAIEMLPAIDLFVVDGPAQYDNPAPMARYPALPLAQKFLKSGAHLLLDDADRNDEQQVVERWLNEFNIEQLHHYDSHYADNEKGAKLLQYNGI